MNVLSISLSNYCNLNCPECPVKNHKVSKWTDYSFDLSKLKQMLEDLYNTKEWVIEITGGEPTLKSEFDELMNILKEYRVSVLTNSSNLLNLPKYENAIFLCSWHEGQMPFDVFGKNIKGSKNKCLAICFPNKNTDKRGHISEYREDAEILFKEHNIPYIYGSWNENPLVYLEIAKLYEVDYKTGNAKLVTIIPNGGIRRCVCNTEQDYANVNQYSMEHRDEFIPMVNKCEGLLYDMMCSTLIRNRILWKE